MRKLKKLELELVQKFNDGPRIPGADELVAFQHALPSVHRFEGAELERETVVDLDAVLHGAFRHPGGSEPIFRPEGAELLPRPGRASSKVSAEFIPFSHLAEAPDLRQNLKAVDSILPWQNYAVQYFDI